MIGPSKLVMCTHCNKLQKDLSQHDCQEYEIECIENIGFDEEGEMMVLIKWMNCEESTWEPYLNLNPASYDLVIDWFRLNELK